VDCCGSSLEFLMCCERKQPRKSKTDKKALPSLIPHGGINRKRLLFWPLLLETKMQYSTSFRRHLVHSFIELFTSFRFVACEFIILTVLNSPITKYACVFSDEKQWQAPEKSEYIKSFHHCWVGPTRLFQHHETQLENPTEIQ